VLAVVTLLGLPCFAAVETPLPAPGRAGWLSFQPPRANAPTMYVPIEAEGSPAVRATSVCAASALYTRPTGVDLERTPRLAWRWRIEDGIDNAAEQTRAKDDFAARVYVTFRFVPERATLRERLKHRLARALVGDFAWGRALVYVWASAAPAGSSWENPRAAGSRIVSLGNGPLPDWRREEVDVRADFRRFFGDELLPLEGVAIMVDTDQTCDRAVAAFADFRFVGP
jgi:hypothetical protein